MGATKPALLCLLLLAMVVLSLSSTIRRLTDVISPAEGVTQNVTVGSPFTILCTPDVDPEVAPEVTWEFKGVPIGFKEPRVRMLSDYTLHISATVMQDTGSYVCVVKTPVDEARAETFLRVQDKPKRPVIDGIECSDNYAVIHWHSTGDNGASIDLYSLELSTKSSPDSPEEWQRFSEHSQAVTWRIYVSPGANYTFRVIVHNYIGFSEPSEASEVCSTEPDVPYTNPDNVRGRGTRPDNMVISWSIIPQQQHNGPGLHYIVSYKRDAVAEIWVEHIVDDWRQSQLVVNNTPTFTRFLIKVAAVNSKGPSRVAPEEVFGRSGEDTPLLAPTKFTLVVVISRNTALFSWNPVPPESLRGHFLGYKIQAWTNDTEVREVVVESTNNMTLLNILEPFKKNYVRIMAYNGCGSGPPSETISFVTPEGTPGPVKSFNAYALGSTAMMLYWEKPDKENGILTGYKVYFAEVMGSDLGPKLELRKIIRPNFTRAKLSNLQPDTRYRIWIHALTETGEGQGFFVEQTTGFAEAEVPGAPHFEASTLQDNKTANILREMMIPPGFFIN